MRAYIFHTKSFLYPDEGIDETLALSTFYGCLYGYKLAGKAFKTDRPTGVHDVRGQEIFEGDEVEIRYDLTRMEMLSGMRSTLRGFVEYSDASYVAVNHEEDWMEYLGEDLLPADCRYYVKIVGNRHEKQKPV